MTRGGLHRFVIPRLFIRFRFPSAQSSFGFERFAQVRQPHLDPRAIMHGFDGAIGQLGNPLNLFAESLPAE
jgi:hypothetical protein